MIKEHWKAVVGYEGYEVSNLGRVRSLGNDKSRKEKVLKAGNKKGYLYVGLYKNEKRKMCRVHRLVAIAFIPNPHNLPEVNHINEDKTDNRIENLEWVSHIQNCRAGTRTQRMTEKLSKQVAQYTLDGTLVSIYPSVREAARQTGFHQGHISGCCRGELKTAYGYIWKYI